MSAADNAARAIVTDDATAIRLSLMTVNGQALSSAQLTPKRALQIAEQLIDAALRHMERSP